MLTVKLQGGLGNQLFQLGFLDYISKITGKQTYIYELHSPSSVHSKNQYYETIFQEWKPLYKLQNAYMINENSNLEYEDWKSKLNNSTNICVYGYFQRYEYIDLIRDEFISKLKFNNSILEKYPEISNKIFIHIRGGDYKNNTFHEINLTKYYQRCMELCKNEEFVIFTNDIAYAKNYFKDIPIIEESEVDTLYLMSKAKGCICANSSFSWWGAYLNLNRPIFMPSKWFNDSRMNISGYYFKGCAIVNT
jgi:hypothetical protein